MYTVLRGLLIALLILAPMALVGCQQQTAEPAQGAEESVQATEEPVEEQGEAAGAGGEETTQGGEGS